jgi:hypothetical protein
MHDMPFDDEKTPLAALGDSESLIVRTYRKILLGNKDCPILARDFAALYGADAGEIYLTFCTLLYALAYASRRPLRVGYPGCVSLTSDERQLLILIAAAQAEDNACFEGHLRWLTRRELRSSLLITLNAFANALRAHGQILSQTKTAMLANDAAPPLRLRLVAGG